MLIWRLTKREHADLSGRGGELVGGRWHTRGKPIVYCAENASLSILEARVHLILSVSPSDYVLMKIDLPDDVDALHIGPADLPPDWRDRQDLTQRIGDAWLGERRSLLLRIPSAIVDLERNVLVNPKHPEFTRLGVPKIISFSWDDRLLQPPVRSVP
jgi:RES domain-containing protein